MKAFLTLSFAFICCHFCKAQSLSVNTDGSTANSSSILDIKSSTKGLLIPRLTKAQKNAVTTPANGLLIYQSAPDSIGFYYYQNSQWNWVSDNRKSDSSYWGLHGNYNTNPPSSSNTAPINYLTDTYLGTYEPADVSLVAGGNELIRLKQVNGGGRIGFSNRNPEYALDIRMSDQSPTSSVLGMRIISPSLFNPGNNINIDKGLVIGNSSVNPNETVIWNHGSNLDASIRIGIDAYNSSIRPAININQFGQGIYQRNPVYLLDIHSIPQFNIPPPGTNKNGARITYPFQENANSSDRGFFMGVGINNSSFKSYVWNYSDGGTQNSIDRATYFGVGGDFELSNNRPSMIMQNGILSVGHVDPLTNFPSALNIQTDYTSSVSKNGLSIIHLTNGQESAYFGLDDNNNLNIHKFGTGNIQIGAPFSDRLTVKTTGHVGIGTVTPNAPLQFADINQNNKIVLHNNNFGDIPNNEHDFFGFGVNDNSILRYQVARNTRAHVFYAGDVNGTASVELMRIKGNGFVGINNNNPQAPLEFSVSSENRKIVLAGFGINNDHNFFGFGRNNGALRYQVPFFSDDHIFYSGNLDGSGSTELMRVKGDGNLGIGTDFPVAYGHSGNHRIVEIKNPEINAPNVQSHLILTSASLVGSLGGFTWAANLLTGEKRTGFIGNSFESPNQTKLSFFTRSNAGALTESFYIQGNGNAWLQGTLTQASDARLKKNVRVINDPIQQLNRISGYSYNWIDESRDKEMQMGLLAQEVQKVYPGLVKKNATGDLSVNYISLIPVLIEAVKAQQQQIDEQRKMIEQLLKK